MPTNEQPNAPDPYIPIRTTVHRGDYQWAARIALKHGCSTDTIMRAALRVLRSLVIAEVMDIDRIKSEGGFDR